MRSEKDVNIDAGPEQRGERCWNHCPALVPFAVGGYFVVRLCSINTNEQPGIAVTRRWTSSAQRNQPNPPFVAVTVVIEAGKASVYATVTECYDMDTSEQRDVGRMGTADRKRAKPEKSIHYSIEERARTLSTCPRQGPTIENENRSVSPDDEESSEPIQWAPKRSKGCEQSVATTFDEALAPIHRRGLECAERAKHILNRGKSHRRKRRL